MKQEKIEKIVRLAKEWVHLMARKGEDNGYYNGYGVVSQEVVEMRKSLSSKGVLNFKGCPGCDCRDYRLQREVLKKILKIREEDWRKICTEMKKYTWDKCTYLSNLNIDGIFRQLVLGEDLVIKIHHRWNQKKIDRTEEEKRLAEERIEKNIKKMKEYEEALERKREEVKENETLITECFF